MPSIRISQENFDNYKSIMHGRSWDQIMAEAYNLLTHTNNNVPSTTPAIPSEYEPNKPVILPSGTALVDSDRYVLDAFGNRCRYPGGRKDASKVSDYLQKMTGNMYQMSDERDFRAAYFLRRWYTREDYDNLIQDRELEETTQFLATRGYALCTEPVSLTPNYS